MNTKICLIGIISLITLTIFVNQISYADNVDKIQPSWTEDLADWWLEEIISDIEFLQVLTYLTNNGIVKILESKDKETNWNESIENSGYEDFSIFYMRIENYGIEPYPGRISTPEPYQKHIEPEKIEVWLRQNKYFENQISYLNEKIKLPTNVVIGLGECQEKKAIYNEDTKMIVICYELISDIYNKVEEKYKSKEFTDKHISKTTLDIIDFIFYHQVSHAILKIISNYQNITILNNDEIFVDSLSNYIKSTVQKNKTNYQMESIALWFKILYETEDLKSPHIGYTHSLNLERFTKIVCQDSSFNSTTTSEYIQKGFLAKQKIIECKSELLEQKPKLEKISNIILK